MALYERLTIKRMEIFFKKKAAALLCTDIAAQGFGYVSYQTLSSV